jgi:hypothetical protein
MLNKQETNNKNLSSELTKLSEELQVLNNIYKETEKELSDLKKKPVHEAEKKRRRYEITKEFVNQLENEQQLYGNTLVTTNRPKVTPGHGNSASTMLHMRPQGASESKPVSPKNPIPKAEASRSNHGYFKSKSPPAVSKSYTF